METIYIKGLSCYIPRGRLSNEDVLSRISQANKDHINKEDLDLILYGSSRKFEFLGIKTRSFCLEEENENIVTMAYQASVQALENAGMRPEDIDCLIVSGVTNPFREPSFAIVCAHQLGIASGDFFDINDTCNGFMKSIDVAIQYLGNGKYRNILVVTSENPYEIARGLGIDYRLNSLSEVDNKFSTLIVGSGAAAMVLSSTGNMKKIVHYCEKRETINWKASLLTIPDIYLPDDSKSPGSKSCGIWTDARLVGAQVIKDLPVFIKQTVAEWNMSLNDFDLFVLHQLGNNVTFATLDQLQIHHEKSPVNTFGEFGNMASANIPVNLATAEEKGMIKKDDSILLVSSACGLSYSLIHIEW